VALKAGCEMRDMAHSPISCMAKLKISDPAVEETVRTGRGFFKLYIGFSLSF
jgi:hypothetical protein